ncbi:MAG: flagellar hook-associated protein FlgL [Gammaproteobacteria bacterium]|nr:flagellar hook-associated protein FlgL [Gammaproteobacteria bacterium]MBU1978266.1 flagellar hook-associated protein FlgL [Gammaproteobacteria bacterium]
MRISTNTIFDMGVAGMQQATSDMVKTQLQITAGRRILTPSDDPVASARVLEVTQSQTLNLQYDTNIRTATSSLSMEDSILGSVAELIVSVRTEAVGAEAPLLTDQARLNIATGLRGRYQELLGLANSTDGNGQYLFSGYQNTKPFSETATLGVVNYGGDQGQRLVQISPSRQLAVSDSGADVFRSGSPNGDIFKTLGDFITKLEDISTPLTAVSADIQKFDQALQNVLRVRASVGTRMNEVDSIKLTGADLQLQYQQTLSGLQDLDYTKAITDLTRQKATLEAAQLSFTKIQGLSLFNYIT